MELLDSGSSVGTTSQPGSYAWVDAEMLADDEVRVGPPSAPPAPSVDLRTRLERLRSLLLRRPGTPAVAAVVAAVLGALTGGYAVSSQHMHAQKVARNSAVDLGVIGANPQWNFGNSEYLELWVQNRGEEPVTIVSGAMGAAAVRQRQASPVPPGGSTTVQIPASTVCGQRSYAGTLSLQVVTRDKHTRSVTLSPGRDFLVADIGDMTVSCQAQTLENSFTPNVVEDRPLGRRSTSLTFDFGFVMYDQPAGAARAQLLTISSDMTGLVVTMKKGWPVRLRSGDANKATVEVGVRDCTKVRLPYDADGDSLLVVSGKTGRSTDLETAPVRAGNLALALQRLILRACPAIENPLS